MNFPIAQLIVVFLGFGMLILCLLRAIGVDLDNGFLLSISISAGLFSAGDYVSYMLDRDKKHAEEKKEEVTNNKYKLFMMMFGYFGGALALVILPPLKLSSYMSTDDMQKLSDIFTLMGFGAVVSVMGFRSAYQYIDVHKELQKRLEGERVEDLSDTTVESQEM